MGCDLDIDIVKNIEDFKVLGKLVSTLWHFDIAARLEIVATKNNETNEYDCFTWNLRGEKWEV